MNRRGGKLSPDPKELPTITKRGLCIYILEVDIVYAILKELFDLLEKGAPTFKEKLSQEESTKIMQEVASYIYFETVKQIWEYQEGDLAEDDARQLLNVISTYYYHSYYIDDLASKLQEYRKAENPIEHVARNIEEIVEHRDTREQFLILAQFAAWIANPEYSMFDGIRKVFELSDAEMAKRIEDFFLNVYPRLIKQ